MRLYFKSGKNHRLMIDTDAKIYSTDYFYLGGWREYLAISDAARREIIAQAVADGYTQKND